MSRTALAPDAAALGSRVRGVPLVLLLDVDGTLAPIAPHPDDARVPDRTRSALDALARTQGVHVGVVSGRAAADARALVGVSRIWAIGNHGLETIDPSGGVEVDSRAQPFVAVMSGLASALDQELTRWPGSYVEDKRLTLSVHVRQTDPAVVPELAALVGSIAARAGLRVTRGNKVLEVRPPVAVDKGTAVRALAERLGASVPGASIIFAGDDATDEDAMRALRAWHADAVTIHVLGVTGWSSAAELEVESPAALAVWLESLARLRGAPAQAGEGA